MDLMKTLLLRWYFILFNYCLNINYNKNINFIYIIINNKQIEQKLSELAIEC